MKQVVAYAINAIFGLFLLGSVAMLVHFLLGCW